MQALSALEMLTREHKIEAAFPVKCQQIYTRLPEMSQSPLRSPTSLSLISLTRGLP